MAIVQSALDRATSTLASAPSVQGYDAANPIGNHGQMIAQHLALALLRRWRDGINARHRAARRLKLIKLYRSRPRSRSHTYRHALLSRPEPETQTWTQILEPRHPPSFSPPLLAQRSQARTLEAKLVATAQS